MSPTFSMCAGITTWSFMVCGKSVQVWSVVRTSWPPASAWRTGQSGVKAQHSAESVGERTPWAPSSENTRASVSRRSSGEVRVQEGLAPRQHALHRLAIRQGRVHLLAELADVHELPVQRLHAFEVRLDALRDPLLVVGGGEDGDERADEMPELAGLVAIVGIIAFVVAAEPLAGPADQSIERPVDPQVERQGDECEHHQHGGGQLPGGLEVDPVGGDVEEGAEGHRDDRGRLELEAHPAFVAEAASSTLITGFVRRSAPLVSLRLLPVSADERLP